MGIARSVDPLSEQNTCMRVGSAQVAEVRSMRDRSITLQLDVVRHNHVRHQKFHLASSKESPGTIYNMQSVSVEANKITIPCMFTMSKGQIVYSCRDEPMLSPMLIHSVHKSKRIKHPGILIQSIIKMYRIDADTDQCALRYKRTVCKRIVPHSLAWEVH